MTEQVAENSGGTEVTDTQNTEVSSHDHQDGGLLGGEEKAVIEEKVEDNRDPVEFIKSLPEDLRAEKALQDFKGSDDLAKSYVELKKKLGQKIEDLTADEIKALAPKFGAPESADAYSFEPVEIPEGATDMTDWFREQAFELGMPADMASKLYDQFNAQQQGIIEAYQLQAKEQQEQSIEQLKKEFGSAFDQRVALANKALREFGGDEAVSALASAGLDSNPALVKMLSEIGKMTSEDASLSGESRTAKFGMTPQEAGQKIAELSADKEFVKRRRDPNHPGHREAMAELDRLYKLKAQG